MKLLLIVITMHQWYQSLYYPNNAQYTQYNIYIYIWIHINTKYQSKHNYILYNCYPGLYVSNLLIHLQALQRTDPRLSKYRMRHKSVNTPLSNERLVGGLQDGGRGTHVTHFVQIYPQPLYTASQVRTTSRSWDEGVITDLCLTGVLTDLCLTLYIVYSGIPSVWDPRVHDTLT